MKNLIRVFLPLIAIIIFVRYYTGTDPDLQAIDNYPVWLRDISGNQTNQTSGFSYIGEKNGIKNFISCDDIGKVNRVEVTESGSAPVVKITPIEYSDRVKELFAKFKKTDMEEIMYDRHSDRILLSIEGHEYSSNDPMIYRKKEGIYEITFNKDIYTFDTLLTIRRLTLPEEIYAHTHDNIGFEGFSATDNFFYIGLENFQKVNDQFTDSTYLYVINRKSSECKTISTRELGITSISGLYAQDDRILFGIDRNMRIMFRIEFDEIHNVVNVDKRLLDLNVPGHKDMSNIAGIAPESITMDDAGAFYVAIDPWLLFYKPDLAQKKMLSDEEQFNFKKEVPILYKYKNEF
jgi:hypothetical protein